MLDYLFIIPSATQALDPSGAMVNQWAVTLPRIRGQKIHYHQRSINVINMKAVGLWTSIESQDAIHISQVENTMGFLNI